VDIRADLYSLGCTFFYLLTGKPPFPSGTMMQKLLRHQNEQPPPVESLRPEVPAGVSAIVRKLLAKRPDDRFQTPAELAEAIADCKSRTESLPSVVQMAFEAEATQAEGLFDDLWGNTSVSPERPVPVALPAEKSRRPLFIGSGIIVLALLGAGIWLATRDGKKPGEPKKQIVEEKQPPILVKNNDPRLKVKEKEPDLAFAPGPVTDGWVAAVQKHTTEKQAKAVFAKLKELNPGFEEEKATFTEVGGIVNVLKFSGRFVSDISPVRALSKLHQLHCPTRQDDPYGITDLGPLKGLPISVLDVSYHRVSDLSPLQGMTINNLNLTGTLVENLSPFKSFNITHELILRGTPVSDLSPLKGKAILGTFDFSQTNIVDLKPLADIKTGATILIAGTKVRDLSPLKDKPLERFDCSFTPVDDLTALGSANLRYLRCDHTAIKSLQPVAKMPLETLFCDATKIVDLTPVKEMTKLTRLRCDFVADRDRAILSGLTILHEINHESPITFWLRNNRDSKELARFIADVAKQPAAKQIDMIRAKLQEFNPGFDAKFEHKSDVNTGQVTSLVIANGTDAHHLTDLGPLRALPFLEHLEVANTYPQPGKLADLTPLRGLKLKSLVLQDKRIYDLAPLTAMSLEGVSFYHCRELADISPLSSENLAWINLLGVPVQDWTPFARMTKLKELRIAGCNVNDISVLKNLPLKTLEFEPFRYDRHAEVLRGLKLDEINGKKPDAFWNEQAEQQVEFVRRELVRLNTGFEKVVAKIEKGAVVNLEIHGKDLQRLDPLRTLTDLHTLLIMRVGDQCPAVSLEPLRGLPLQTLHIVRLTPESFAPLEGMKLDSLRVHFSGLNDVASLKGVAVRNLYLGNDRTIAALKDLSPLQGKPLESLWLYDTGVNDLSPLAGMPLKEFIVLHFNSTQIADLAPLRNMPLTTLNIGSSKCSDLTPLRTLKALKVLHLGMPRVKDLRPLEHLPLEFLSFDGTKPESLAPLKSLPLKTILNLNFEPFRGDADVLKAIASLQTINYKKANEFLKEADDKMAAFQKWSAGVAKLPAKEQAQAVEKELIKRNPAMTAVLTLTFKDDKVVGLHLSSTQDISDMAPVRALPALRELSVGSNFGEPMNAMRNSWSNLNVLRGLRLERLRVGNSDTTDLLPLSEMKTLTHLDVRDSKVDDLSPLHGLPLQSLNLYGNPVKDLAPLHGMPLTFLLIASTAVADLSPVVKSPLEELGLDFVSWRDSALVRSIKSLRLVNSKPAKEFHAWADWEGTVRALPPNQQIEMVAAKLKELNADFDGKVESVVENGAVVQLGLKTDTVTDISPVRALPKLRNLYCGGSMPGKGKLADLSPLSGLNLVELGCSWNKITSLAPLRGASLKRLHFYENEIKDLSPLRETAIESVNFNVVPERDTLILKEIKTLKTINGKPAAEVLGGK